jgi:phosphinothricin acetyltransferase
VIRRATASDIEAIRGVYNQAVVHSTATWDHDEVSYEDRVRWFDAHNTGRNVTLVAEIDGQVVGYAGYGEFRSKIGWADTVEHSVYLLPDARGHGLGTRLLVDLISAARSNGIHAMVGVLSSDNDVSVRLHRALGFVEVGRMPQVGNKFGRWLDAVFLELVLDERRRPGDPLTEEA